jgi:type IV pilus assembly protein PilW
MSGLSLIELMVSITLGLMILAGVAIVFTNSSAARNEVERTSRQIENGRYAVEVLSDELRLAGFYGELDVGTVADPASMPGDQCSVAATDWQSWIKLHVQGWASGTGFDQTTCALQNHKAGTDILLVRRARACIAGTSGCQAAISGRGYLQVSLCGTEVTTHKLGNLGTETFDLKKKDCTNNADLRRYYVRVYYISTDNGSGVSVPTLKQMELDGSSYVTTPLVEGIEELKILYGVDTTNDGAPDSYVATPASLADWMNVVAVQVHLLARNLETSPGYTDSKTYTLGGTAFTPGGSYRRHVYSSLVRINNASGRKDHP